MHYVMPEAWGQRDALLTKRRAGPTGLNGDRRQQQQAAASEAWRWNGRNNDIHARWLCAQMLATNLRHGTLSRLAVLGR